MRAAIFQGPKDIRLVERPDPAGVKAGGTVAVVGDGAVGLCAVLASKRLGAERIIVLSRHSDPGPVLDFETALDGTPVAYAAMDDRRAIESLIRVASR
jgi:D-arabinose 1-dehydrogenase-like Zn-dependent alcohol dehydrogenase